MAAAEVVDPGTCHGEGAKPIKPEELRLSVETDKVQTLVSGLGLGTVGAAERLEEGFQNTVYFVTTDKGRYVLRLTNPLPKWRTHKTESEVAVMKYVRENTDIPVPRIHGHCSDAKESVVGYEWILMDRAAGTPLDKLWDDMSEETRLRMIAVLAGYIAELRRHKFPMIGSFDASMNVVADVDSRKGPFKTEFEYYSSTFLTTVKELQDANPELEGLCGQLREYARTVIPKHFPVSESPESDGDPDKFPLAHLDILPKNVMVDAESLEVTALLDWEWAGPRPADAEIDTIHWDGVDAEAVKRIMIEAGVEAPEGWDDRHEVRDMCEQYVMARLAYRVWYADKEGGSDGPAATKLRDEMDEHIQKALIGAGIVKR